MNTTARVPPVTPGVLDYFWLRYVTDASYCSSGPSPPAGRDNNWIQTIPGKGWNMLFRLHGPLEPRLDKTWRLGEIDLIR